MTKLRIVTTGLAVTYPFGGVFWDYIQYFLGFAKLGHDVLYLEDTGKWCYAPDAGTYIEDGAVNAAAFARHIAQLDNSLAERWSFRDARGQTYGRVWHEAVQFCREADLFVNISASCCMGEEYQRAQRVAFVDSDPLYTQAGLMNGSADDPTGVRTAWFKNQHDVFFTFGENIDRTDCTVPTVGIRWRPTRQPIVLDCFANVVPSVARRKLMTTVASWEPKESGPVVNGVAYGGKSAEFLRFIELPAISPLPIEVALSGPAPIAHLRRLGWQIRDGYEVSKDPWTYRDYLAQSAGEWSVAKNAYVATHSGWFSCRTACYLALGVPAVVQDTGFSRFLPTGEGLLAFGTLDDAAAAINEIVRAPDSQSTAARSIAAEYFDSGKVLTRLIDDAFASQS